LGVGSEKCGKLRVSQLEGRQVEHLFKTVGSYGDEDEGMLITSILFLKTSPSMKIAKDF
jgi:hypothetical protein